MKSINLTRNGQTINITKSGYAIVDGRKYKVDLDFATGKVELTYMCQDDGTLSADFQFDKIKFYADKKTTPNTSKSKKPIISGTECIFTDGQECFKCLSEKEKSVINTIYVTRDYNKITDISDLFIIAKNTVFSFVETIKRQKSTGKTVVLTVSFKDGDNTQWFKIIHYGNNANSLDVQFIIKNPILNNMYSYIIAEISSELQFELNSISLANISTTKNINFLEGVTASSISAKNVTIFAKDFYEAILLMQLLRCIDTPDKISIYINENKLLYLEKNTDGYTLNISKCENTDETIYLYKAFSSITSTDNLKEVKTYDKDGNEVASHYVDTTDYSYDFVNSYVSSNYGVKGYFQVHKYSRNYVCDGYGQAGYFCEMGDEVSKYENVNSITDGYVEDGYTEKFDNVPKDKTNPLLPFLKIDKKCFLDINIIKKLYDKKEFNGEEELIQNSVNEEYKKMPMPSLVEQAKRGRKIFVTNGYMSSQEFRKLVKNGATYIKTRDFVYKNGVEMKFFSNTQSDFSYLTYADVPKVTGNVNVCSYNRLPQFNKSIKSFTARYILESYVCSNKLGTAFNEDAGIFNGNYPIAYKYLDECVLRKDNGDFYTTTTERGLIRDKITKKVVTGGFNHSETYLVNYMLKIVSIDRIKGRVEDWRRYPPRREPERSTFADGMPRPLKKMHLLDNYVKNMSNTDKTFVYAFIEAMKYFDNPNLHFKKHFGSLFQQLMDGEIYVFRHSNFRVYSSYPLGTGASGVHFYKSKNAGENDTHNYSLKWDSTYLGAIEIKLTKNGYVFHSVDYYEKSIIKRVCSTDRGLTVCDGGETPKIKYTNINTKAPNSDEVIYSLNKGKDGSVTISWDKGSKVDAKFFQINDKKLKVGD